MKTPAAWEVGAFRVAVGAWLVGWYFKVYFQGTYLLSDTFEFPVWHDSLPGILSGPWLSAICYVAPILSLVALWKTGRRSMQCTSIGLTACAFLLCIHLNTFNDATFVTSTWTGLWLVWLSWAREDSQERKLCKARALAQCVVALMFLGGFTGKLIPEYWSGEALLNIYMLQKPNFPWAQVRSAVTRETLEFLAMLFGRGTVVMEGAMIAAPLVPYRWFALGGGLTMLAIVGLSTWNLFSVFGCLLGMMAAVYREPPQPGQTP